MRRSQRLALTFSLALLALLPTAFAHGDYAHHEGMEMGASHLSMTASNGTSIAHVDEFEYNPSYFHYPEHAGLIYSHIVLSLVSWVLVLPVAVMLSIARSHYTVLAQTAYLVFNGLALVTGIIYNHATPDLYENNAHHKIGWIVTWIALGWSVMGLVLAAAGAWKSNRIERPSLRPTTTQALADYRGLNGFRKMEDYRWSHDSGQGSERNTDSLCSGSRSSSMNSETQPLPTRQAYEHTENDEHEDDTEAEKQSFLHNKRVDSAISRFFPRFSSGKAILALDVAHTTLERFIILLGFVAITTGIVTYGGIFRGNNIFNGLAHFVKGGIFFWYGILTFGRWMGCFADFGWAWNIKPGTEIVGRKRAWIPSAEFTESFVIWLYGASNVFMEHLSGSKEWSPMDLEHVAISILFFGGGALGMLIDSQRVREMLNSAFGDTGAQHSHQTHAERWHTPKSAIHSLNPMPALTIMLLGLMMSSHTQDSMVSSMLHKQWGQLFSAFALARGMTYLLLWLKPPTSYLPSRPPTEILASFCLISGGLIFMASNKDTVAALEHYGLHAMFVWTLVMSLVALLMAWEVVLIAIKNWAWRHNTERSYPASCETSEA